MQEFHDVVAGAEPGMGFTAHFRVEWRRPSTVTATRASAVEACGLVRALVEGVAAGCSVLRPAATEQDINGVLARKMPLRTDTAEVTWAQVSLTVDEQTRHAAHRLAQIRHEIELDALARKQTLARINFLYDEVLRDPAAARIYLMLEHSARIGDLPTDLDLDRVVREIQQWHPSSKWVVTAQLLHTFVEGLTTGDADDLLHTLHSLFTDYGEKELAARLPLRIAEKPESPDSSDGQGQPWPN
ncbi:hypothetical protein [Streptomyces yaizuensis]|uniref:Uncharacterized protein n=1 Tax=Streptomyces yaizuensis TaxID=2989713 RepID=A0ABQ5P3B2_9ACTN|nr:hypothetical protein [Streptomyces sp. YSPA8]GLF96980.1 hypothetical protein SYYSPA8_21805 [Streptomyces sp. YSPA8]